MNLVKKVRFRRQHDTSPKAKFLSVNQQQKNEIERKHITKIHQEKYNKKEVKRPPKTNDQSRKSQQSAKGRSKR